MKDLVKSYRDRHRALGLCIHCPEPLFRTSLNFCYKHLVLRRKYCRKKAGCKPWRRGSPGRPPLEVA